ncbi:hypothetical protein LLH00_12150 [bacterium]|nr:hypothetical protein [bacterium]
MLRHSLILFLTLCLTAPALSAAEHNTGLAVDNPAAAGQLNPFRVRLALRDTRVIRLQPQLAPVLLLEYRCDRGAGVSALLQKIELGTGRVEDQCRIYSAEHPAEKKNSERYLAYGMGSQPGFSESGLYSILLQARRRDGRGENLFVAFYWDSGLRSIEVVTSGRVSEAELARINAAAGDIDYTSAEPVHGR